MTSKSVIQGPKPVGVTKVVGGGQIKYSRLPYQAFKKQMPSKFNEDLPLDEAAEEDFYPDITDT